MEEEGPSSDVLTAAAALVREPDAIDTGIATFILVSGLLFFVIWAVAMVLFFQERNSFEIRARSPYLSLLNGLCFMAFMITTVVRHIPGTFLDASRGNIYATYAVLFFIAGCLSSCYASRTIRLLLLYSLRARKAAPWLVSERNHVVVCLLLGAASMAVPLYDMGQVDDGPFREVEYMLLVSDHYWIFLFSTQAGVLLLNPIAWFIDDLFGIGPELRVMIVAQVVTIVGARLAEEYAEPDVLRWINGERLGFLADMIMISISIIGPIWRRIFHPLQSSDPKVVRALARRRASAAQRRSARHSRRAIDIVGVETLRGRLRSHRTSIGPTSASGIETYASSGDGGSFSFSSTSSPAPHPVPAASSPGSWTYERVMMMPETAAALEKFSRKALCQESFLFLRDATAYQDQDFGEVEAGHADASEGADGGGGGINGDEKSEGQNSGIGADGSPEQFALFSKIVKEYIIDGSPNEINISWEDKNDILSVYSSKNRSKSSFYELSASARRLVFSRAFAEVRYVLESNLMQKFISTGEFATSLSAAGQRQALCSLG